MYARKKQILQLMEKNEHVKVIELAQLFNVSLETVRRDLNSLAKQGLIHRTHGGAVSIKIKDIGHSFQCRQRTNFNRKHAIAQKAIEYLYENIVIGLDASTTSWHFAQLIPDIPCTVVTNSMHNIKELVNKPNVTTIATGGVYSSKYNAFYGPLSETLLQRLHIDIGIFSCIGLDSNGTIWESNELNASVKRKMFDKCEQKFLLADSSKFEKKNLIHLLDLKQMDILFTDELPNLELQDYCRNNQILITQCDTQYLQPEE